MTGQEAKHAQTPGYRPDLTILPGREHEHDDALESDFPAAASPRRGRALPWAVSGLLALSVLGYMAYARVSVAPAAPPPQGPVPVEVRTMAPATVRLWSDFSAHTRAVDQAEIRPEVSGRIVEIRFKDGQTVKAGDALLVIDPRPYQAALAKAKADLETARTNANFANTELARAESMIKTGAIAQTVYDQRVNENRTATAAVQAAEASVQSASLDVEHAYVRAPIGGRTGRTELTVGNLVQAGPGAPLLTSVVSTDGIYADFEVDEQTYMSAIHSGSSGDDQAHIPVQLTIGAGESAKVYNGAIDSFDNHIDPATGTIRARAKFANEDGALVPGMFASIRLADSHAEEAIMVPEKAISTDQDKKFVYVVGADNKVQYRPVKLGSAQNDQRVVLSGLQKGDRVIVDGVQHVRPDAMVTAKEETLDASPTPATQGQNETDSGNGK